MNTGLIRRWLGGMMQVMQDLKMLFSSRARVQAEFAREKLTAAGIRCEVRSHPVDPELSGTSFYSELWVEANPDYHTASILYASPVQILRQRAGGRV